MKRCLFWILVGGLLLYSFEVYAQKPCLNCHAEIKKQLQMGYVHSPLKKGECTVCHSSHTSDSPHLLKKTVKETCLSCHKKVKVKYAHLPVADGKCTQCHNPHASVNKWLLRKPPKQLCFQCHKKDNLLIGKRVHKPVSQNCLSCHKAHGSNYQFLLTTNIKEICFACHSQNKVGQIHKVQMKESTSCLSCHNVHAASGKFLLRQYVHQPYAKGQCKACHQIKNGEVCELRAKDSTLCLKCHPKVFAEKGIYNHLEVGLNQNPCLDCHSPHRADVRPMLKARPYRICLSCHQETKRRLFSASKKYRYKHPNVKNKKCLVCHYVHASNDLFFLKQGGINTCLSCHGKHIKFSHPMGEKAIDPRNHQPITCITCHHPMGAKDKYNVIFDHNKELCIQCHQIGT